MSKRRFLHLASSLGLAAVLTPLVAVAQDIPKSTISLIVGFAAGGATDAAARIIAKKLQENLGLNVVVENHPGAGGNIAHQTVARGKSDGSVILLGSIGPLAIAPHLMKVSYDPQKDLAPLTMGVTFPNVLVVHSGLGVKTLAEYVAKAKAKPGSLDYASTGAGSASHLAGELLNQRAGIDVVHVPYKGGSQVLQDLLGGRVASYFATPSTAAPHIQSGQLVPLATTALTRPASMREVPTIDESGYPGFNATNWYAFVAPAKTPGSVLDRWNAELVKVLKSPDVSAELERYGLTPAPGTRDELAAFIAAESEGWGRLVRERKISAN